MSLHRILNSLESSARSAKFGAVGDLVNASFHGYGVWAYRNGQAAPNPVGFESEINGNGWHTRNWRFISTGSSPTAANYEFRFEIVNENLTSSVPSITVIRDRLANYLYYYFNDVTLYVDSYTTTQVGGSNTGGTGATGTYTVVAGDTLSRIAARFGLTLAQLLALNPQITNPNLIQIGQVINIVRGSGSQVNNNTNPATAPATIPANSSTPNPPKNNQNWFDKTFFTGAGTLSGAAIGVLAILATVVIINRRGI